MEIHVYGKQGCKLCKSAIKKAEVMLKKWDKADQYDVKLIDMETVHGAAEGDYFDVFDIPAVFVMRDEWTVEKRWDGKAPPSDELFSALESDASKTASHINPLFPG